MASPPLPRREPASGGGVIVDLSYQNPCLSPLDEFSRMKQQPLLTQHLVDGKRIAHGTRAITKGGINCLAKMTFSGGLFIGQRCYTRGFAKIRGLGTKPSVTFWSTATVMH